MGYALLRSVALVAAVVTVLLAVAGAMLRTTGPVIELTFNVSSPGVFWISAAGVTVYAVVGSLLARRLPAHPVPWIFLGLGLGWSLVLLTWAWVMVALSRGSPVEGPGILALLNTALVQPTGLGLLVLLLHLFPDGRPVDAISRRLALATPLAVLLVGLGIALSPGSVGVFTGLPNPLQPAVPPGVGRSLSVVGVMVMAALLVAGCRSLLIRYRAGSPTMRAQIRWFAWAGGIGAFVLSGFVALTTLDPGLLRGPGETVMLLLFSAAAVLVPLACAMAILRHGLYEIDRLISRTFVSLSLLAVVAGGYSAGMKGLDRLVTSVTGQSSDLVAVLTTLILAVSFEPLKIRLTRFAKRFEEAPEEHHSALPAPDEAWIELVAGRVIERLESRRPMLPGRPSDYNPAVPPSTPAADTAARQE